MAHSAWFSIILQIIVPPSIGRAVFLYGVLWARLLRILAFGYRKLSFKLSPARVEAVHARLRCRRLIALSQFLRDIREFFNQDLAL